MLDLRIITLFARSLRCFRYKRFIELDDAASIVKYSYIARKSIEYLDLNIGEYSAFKIKCGDLQGFAVSTPNVQLLNHRFAGYDEYCKKSLLDYRKLLYTLHLDVPNSRDHTMQELAWFKKFCHGGRTLSPCVVVPSGVYRRQLNCCMRVAVLAAAQRPELIRRFVKFMKFYNGSAMLQDSVWFDFLCILCRESKNSEIVKEFLIEVDVGVLGLWVSQLKPDECDSFFYHAQRIMDGVWKHKFQENNPIERCLLLQDFQKIPHLLKHFNSQGYSENSHMLLSCFLSEAMSIQADDVCLHRLLIPNEEGKISKEINFLFLQIMWFFFKRGSSEHASVALRLLWRTNPAAYFSLDEVLHAYGGVLNPRFLEDVHAFYTNALCEDTSTSSPRPLRDLCRVSIRRALANNLYLSQGIGKLGLPYKMQSFLRLEW